MPSIRIIAAVAALAAAITPAPAQNWPTRPVTMVLPFAAGGPLDGIGRILAARLSDVLGQQVVVENITGAGGTIGSNRVAKAAPDGYQFLLGHVGTHAFSQTLYSEVLVALSYEPQQAAVGTDDDKTSTPVARGLPRSWSEIEPGHLVIAQESLPNGWWEAIVIDRKDDMLTLRFRDYPRLPKFFRHCSAVALMSPAGE